MSGVVSEEFHPEAGAGPRRDRGGEHPPAPGDPAECLVTDPEGAGRLALGEPGFTPNRDRKVVRFWLTHFEDFSEIS